MYKIGFKKSKSKCFKFLLALIFLTKNGGLEQCVFLGNTLYFPVKLEDASWESPDSQTLPRRIQVLFFLSKQWQKITIMCCIKIFLIKQLHELGFLRFANAASSIQINYCYILLYFIKCLKVHVTLCIICSAPCAMSMWLSYCIFTA